jgi:hypothetical protein
LRTSIQFLSTTKQELWARAREVWGVHGYPAVATFDMAAVGLEG